MHMSDQCVVDLSFCDLGAILPGLPIGELASVKSGNGIGSAEVLGL